MIRGEERMKVLRMVEAGKITAEQATQLLEALDEAPTGPKGAPAGSGGPAVPANMAGRWFRVRVTDSDTGKVRVNVRLPVGVVNAGLKMGMRFAPQVEGLDLDSLSAMINSGEVGQIVDVFDDKDGEHVEVYIE